MRRQNYQKFSYAQAKKDELVNGTESLLSELDKEKKVEEVDVKPKTKVVIIIIIITIITLIIITIINKITITRWS